MRNAREVLRIALRIVAIGWVAVVVAGCEYPHEPIVSIGLGCMAGDSVVTIIVSGDTIIARGCDPQDLPTDSLEVPS